MTKASVRRWRSEAPQSLQAFLKGPPRIGQRELAEAVGCNQSTISMILRGLRNPSAALIRELNRVTGVPLAVLHEKPRRPKKRQAKAALPPEPPATTEGRAPPVVAWS